MILPYQVIKKRCLEEAMIVPCEERTVGPSGMTYGLSSAGYDLRVAQSVYLNPGAFDTVSTIENFNIPNDILPMIVDKSTWARQGLSVFNTVAEPGWRGFLTVELKNQGAEPIVIHRGMPICQMLFFQLTEPTDKPYAGKYQDQPNHPVPAIFEVG